MTLKLAVTKALVGGLCAAVCCFPLLAGDEEKGLPQWRMGLEKIRGANNRQEHLLRTLAKMYASGSTSEELVQLRKEGLRWNRVSMALAHAQFNLAERVANTDVQAKALLLNATLKSAAWSLLGRNIANEAAEDYKRLASSNSSVAAEAKLQLCSLLIRRARRAYYKGNFPESLALCGRAREYTASAQQRRELLILMSRGLSRQNDRRSAYDALAKMTNEDPNTAEVWLNRGIVAQAIGKTRDALESYQKARICGTPQATPGAWLFAARLTTEGAQAWRLLEAYRDQVGIDYGYAITLGEMAKRRSNLHLARVLYAHAHDIFPRVAASSEVLLELTDNKAERHSLKATIERMRIREGARGHQDPDSPVFGGVDLIGTGRSRRQTVGATSESTTVDAGRQVAVVEASSMRLVAASAARARTFP